MQSDCRPNARMVARSYLVPNRTALDRHLAEYSSCNFPALLRGDRNRGRAERVGYRRGRRDAISSNDGDLDKRREFYALFAIARYAGRQTPPISKRTVSWLCARHRAKRACKSDCAGDLHAGGIKPTSGSTLVRRTPARKLDMFYKIYGSASIRRQLERGVSAASIVASWRSNVARFHSERAPYLIY